MPFVLRHFLHRCGGVDAPAPIAEDNRTDERKGPRIELYITIWPRDPVGWKYPVRFTRSFLRYSTRGRQMMSAKNARHASVLTEVPALTAPRPRAPQKGKNPFTVVFTMLITGGLIAAAGLPAYASAFERAETVTAAPAEKLETQTVVVDGSAATSDIARVAFSATTTAELAKQKKDAARALAASLRTTQRFSALSSSVGTVVQSGENDYPWADAPTGGAFSPLRYVYRQCVDFVAWRLNRDAGSTQAPFKYDWGYLTPGGGNGRDWLPAWKSHGWPVSDVPIPGAVAYTGGNHVAYVKEVRGDGTVLLEEYNYKPHEYSQRVVSAGAVVAFLYPPPR
jgi:surface antigen